MTALREVLAKFSFDADTKAVLSANAAVDTLVGSLGKIDGLIGAGLAGLGLGVFKSQADELARESADLGKAAIKSGLGFEEFQKLTYTSGLSAEKLTSVFRKLQQTTAAAGGKALDASAGFDDLDGGLGRLLSKGDAQKIFKDLGVKASEDVGENFDNIVSALAKVQDPSKRAAAAVKIFGRAGSDLIPFLQKSPADLKRLGEEFDTFGGISETQRTKLKAYSDQTRAFDLAVRALKIELVTSLVPGLTSGFKSLVSLATGFKKGHDTSQLLTSGLIALGAAFVVVKGGAIASAVWAARAWAGPIAAVAAFAIVLDDVIHFIKGDAITATGALIDKFFGAGSGDSVAEQMRKDIKAYIEAVQNAKGPTETLLQVFGGLGKGIISVFEETLPGVWEEFWNQVSVDLLGEQGSFTDLVKEAFLQIGATASDAMLSGLRSTLGEGISKAIGLSDLSDQSSAFLSGRVAESERRKAGRQANADINAGAGDYAKYSGNYQGYNPALPYGPQAPVANPFAPPPAERVGTTTLNAPSTVTINYYGTGDDIDGLAVALRSQVDQANAHAVDALEKRGSKK